jgi:hypothetical protein
LQVTIKLKKMPSKIKLAFERSAGNRVSNQRDGRGATGRGTGCVGAFSVGFIFKK